MKLAEVRDTRIQVGPNLLTNRRGAVLDVAVSSEVKERFIKHWKTRAERMLQAIGWPEEEALVRCFQGGASLMITTPVGFQSVAVTLAGWALEAALALMRGVKEPPFVDTSKRLQVQIRDLRRPTLMALKEAAEKHGLSFLADEKMVSVGTGGGSETWSLNAIPDPGGLDWEAYFDVPVLVVTGANGKTTTITLLAAMAVEAGFTVGVACSEVLKWNDGSLYTTGCEDPARIRGMIRDKRVDLLILELNRDVLWRDGLPVSRAQVAVITNVAEDRLGMFGLPDVDALACLKQTVKQLLGENGVLVVNGEDPELLFRALLFETPLFWFAGRPDEPEVAAHLEQGGDACFVEDDKVVTVQGGTRSILMPVNEAPITLRGRAGHNVANVLAAVSAATAAKLPFKAIAAGLRKVKGGLDQLPGNSNLIRFNGVQVLLDFVPNVTAMTWVVEAAKSIPASRKLLTLAVPDRWSQPAVALLGRSVWDLEPNLVYFEDVKGGGEAGADRGAALLKNEALKCGLNSACFEGSFPGVTAIVKALESAKSGDLVILLTHAERGRVLKLMRTLVDQNWGPGKPLPKG